MCRIKRYSQCIQDTLISVMLRFDTYLLEDDKECVIKILRDTFGGNLAELNMDDYLQQKLDVDSIALIHETSITEVIRTPALILKDIRFEGSICDIYVHKYFISLYCETRQTYKIDLSNLQQTIKNRIVDNKNDISIISCCVRMFHSVANLKNEDLWDVLDKSAFPIIEGNIPNGRYSDTLTRENVNIDLIRTISPSQEEGLSDIYIQAMTFVSLENIRQSIEYIDNMFQFSKEEVSRCFSDNYGI